MTDGASRQNVTLRVLAAASMFAGDWSLADGPATVETARERLAESRLGEPARARRLAQPVTRLRFRR